MIRGRGILTHLRYFHGDHHHDRKNLQSISDKPFFKNYQKAVTLTIENKLEEANIVLRESLKQIALSKEDNFQHYSYILKRITHNYRRLGQNKKAEETLYELIKHQRKDKNSSNVTLYDHYNLLFKHLITYDLEKASKLCKALLKREQEQMPAPHVKIFNMNLGITYLLAGNYEDAKKRLSKCLESDPQGTTKAYALNNLGLACWWHKNPFEKYNSPQADINKDKISNDYEKSKQLFCKSLYEAEKINKLNDQQRKFMMNQTLTLQTEKLQSQLHFQHQQSLFPLYNLAEFYLANDPIQHTQIVYWYNKGLTLAQKTKNDKVFDRIYVEYSLLHSHTKMLEQLLPTLIQKYRYSQQFSEESYYCKIYAKILEINKKNEQAMEFRDRAHIIDQVLPSWFPKIRYIAYDQLKLVE